MITACAGSLLLAAAATTQFLTAEDVARWPSPPADQRIFYGPSPLEFGDLRLPEGPGPHPVAVVLHGGCWLSRWDLRHIGRFAAALAREGLATWAIEYRRVGDPGGGWPGTFADVAHGIDYLRLLAKSHPLDLERVVLVGHSAGGHLALWAAARHRIAEESPLWTEDPLPVRAVVALASAPDLARVHRAGVCDGVVDGLLGGGPEDVPERYRAASPIEMVPLGTPQVLVDGAHDLPRRLEAVRAYEEAARAAGDDVRRIEAPDAAHFELIDPASSSWPLVRAAILSAAGVAAEIPKETRSCVR